MLMHRILECMDKNPYARPFYKNNNAVSLQYVSSSFVKSFINKWFSLISKEDPLIERHIKTREQLIDFLVVNPRGTFIYFNQDIFSLALACQYCQRVGIPEGAVVKNWYREALINSIEDDRLKLTRGNLTFYNQIGKGWRAHSVIKSEDLWRIAAPHALTNKEDFFSILNGQGIILESGKDEYRFSNSSIRLIFARGLTKSNLSVSDALALALPKLPSFYDP